MNTKDLHTAIFSGPTSCGKTQRMLDVLERENKHHFDDIIILCPTLRWNKTYLDIAPNGNLFQVVEKLSSDFSGEETLFIVVDMIANESLDKRRQPLLGLAISGRHHHRSLWLLTAIQKNIRRQKKHIFLWYP